MNTNPPKSIGFGGMLVVALAWLSPAILAAQPADRPSGETAHQGESTPSAGTDGLTAQTTGEGITGTERLPKFVITTGRYKALLTPLEILKLRFHGRMVFRWPTVGPGPFVFTPGRVPQGPDSVPCTVHGVDGDEVLNVSPGNVAGLLRSVLDFSLTGCRECSAAQLHEQGIALRGIGSAGAGALVLLDGVPLNEPFGGCVEWPAAPREGVDGAEVVLGGGAPTWGNGALGGVVQLFTLPARGKLVDEPGTPNDGGPPDPNLTKTVVRQTTQLSTAFGQNGTRSAEIVSAQPTEFGVLQILGREFYTDGYPVVASRNRGAIDRNIWSKQSMLETRWHQPVGKDLDLTTTVRGYRESDGEGTPDQQSRSSGEFASVAIASAPSIDFTWSGTAYLRHRSHTANYTVVNADRSTETPLIGISAEPATACGSSWTGLWWGDSGQRQARTVAGSDFIFVRGEVRENREFSNGTFTRERVAGGEQGIVGFFASRDQPLTSTLSATVAARLDLWRDADGHHCEIDRLSGAQLSNERFTTDNGAEISPSLGGVWRPAGNWLVRANAQESFRRPTLGERYETYTHNSIVTAPNSGLNTEHNTAIEIGTEYKPIEVVTLGVTAFSNELSDALGKVRIARGSGEAPFFDSLPPGYIVQKRINFDRVRVQGLKLSADWKPIEAVTLAASVLFNDPTILRSTVAPQLAGKRMAQVSRQTALLSAMWQTSAKLTFRFRVRYLGRQFVDDENTLRLGEAVVADLGVNYDLTKHTELYLTADNLADSVVETSRSDDGTVYIGSPRIVLAGVRLRW